jgi:hypothetical protein
MNSEDETGKTLSIFERVSRTIRGERNRDLTLAKIEWARKEALNKQKSLPNTKSQNQRFKQT